MLVVSDDVEREISEAAYGRRTFLRRLAVGSAFAVPVVSSFSMAGIQAVSAQADQSNPPIGNCNSTAVWNNNQTLWNHNQNFGYGNPTIGCGNQQGGFLGLLEEIFQLFAHPHRPI